MKYGVIDDQINEVPPNYTNWLSKDDDGDGVTNGDEIAAGTNPFMAGSALRVTMITTTATNVSVTFPTQSGKQYVLQGSATLSGFVSLSPTVSVVGDGSSKTLTGPKGSYKFFRVLVQDIDTDGDGLADWAEIAVNLNPNAAETVPGTNDLTYVNQQIALSNVVTIQATNSFASEDGPTAGTLTISRQQNLFPITVTYGVSGTAVASTDFSPLAGSVTFPARGVTSQDVTVMPIVQGSVKGSRSVTASLNGPGAGDFPFALGAPNAATVIINPSTTATGTGLTARYYDNASTTYANAANFGVTGTYTFTRGSPTTTATVVVTATASQIAGLQVGHLVDLTFTSGSSSGVNNATFNSLNYAVTAVTSTTFSVLVTSGSAFTISSTSGSCNFSIQSIPQPAVITRVDPTVNFDWEYGTPNGNTDLTSPD
ncbi:MAG TPA: thrombospondin type 3 repeat-containing protein, partial [Verrucomicrobiaceae bacterium]